jgi:DNA primase
MNYRDISGDATLRSLVEGVVRVRRSLLIRDIHGDNPEYRFTNSPLRILVCKCPFHRERTPSFRMKISGYSCCFGCGYKGSVAELLYRAFKPCSAEELVQLLRKYTVQRQSVLHPDQYLLDLS